VKPGAACPLIMRLLAQIAQGPPADIRVDFPGVMVQTCRRHRSSPKQFQEDDVTLAANKAFVQQFIDEIFNDGNIDALAEYCVPGSFLAGGLAGQLKSMKMFAPDLQFTVDEMVAEGDKVVVRMTQRGTNSGPMVGLPAFGRLEEPVPPTNKPLRATSIYIFTLAGGKLASIAYELDQIGMLRQLGWTINPPEQA
jgi:predicted ester cyclase